MQTEAKTADLLDFIKTLKDNGFTVYAPENMTTYCFIVKDNHIGYVERGDYGFAFTTIHKPCRECGTGYFMHREIGYPTIEMAQDSLTLAPAWALSADVMAIRKYKNWQEYANDNKWQNYKEV